MSMPTIAKSSSADLRRAVNTIMFAFVDDPFLRFMGPDSDQYMGTAKLISALASASIEAGGSFLASNANGICGAASLWFPPGQHAPEEALERAIGEAVPEARQETVGRVLAATEAFHPDVPHWYLAILGADTHFQGQGLGAALLKHTLAICDQEGRPAYLESSNPRNISIYERHGFAVMDEIRIGDCPVITPMLRPAR
ncbi:MAG: GNAT family N-acetyltransferase [bacterium]